MGTPMRPLASTTGGGGPVGGPGGGCGGDDGGGCGGASTDRVFTASPTSAPPLGVACADRIVVVAALTTEVTSSSASLPSAANRKRACDTASAASSEHASADVAASVAAVEAIARAASERCFSRTALALWRVRSRVARDSSLASGPATTTPPLAASSSPSAAAVVRSEVLRWILASSSRSVQSSALTRAASAAARAATAVAAHFLRRAAARSLVRRARSSCAIASARLAFCDEAISCFCTEDHSRSCTRLPLLCFASVGTRRRFTRIVFFAAALRRRRRWRRCSNFCNTAGSDAGAGAASEVTHGPPGITPNVSTIAASCDFQFSFPSYHGNAF